MGFWSEIRNDFFVTDIDNKDGAMLANISIDGWKTPDDNEQGCVIARVMLSKHGDILVDYHDNAARMDEVAQEAIWNARERLEEYYFEILELKDLKEEKVVYFGEGFFKTHEDLKAIALAAANEFISKVHMDNGKIDSKHSFTYDFGSPYDEIDLYCEYSESDRSWRTVCTLYDKSEDPRMSAIQSVETISSAEKIADTICELVRELDMDIEPKMVAVMKEKLESLDKKLSLSDRISNASQKGTVLETENAVVKTAISDPERG